MTTESDAPIVLSATGLVKTYGAITALGGVDITIRAGEVLAIIGDNGAGKSTLIKILSGVIQPDSGEIQVLSEKAVFRGPHHARAKGIETVFQDLALAPNRDVVQNLFLGREICYGGLLAPLRILQSSEMRRRATMQLSSLEIKIPKITGVAVSRLSGGQRQAVAIARAAFWASKVMFMDEPTAALGVRESAAVLRLARRVADDGLAVVMVSHVMPHVLELADRVLVLRHGRKIAEVVDDLNPQRLIELIVGAEVEIYEQTARAMKQAAILPSVSKEVH